MALNTASEVVSFAKNLEEGGGKLYEDINAYSPMFFSQNSYQLVVMPMLTEKAQEQQKAEAKAKTETPAEPVAEKPKAKPKRTKQPVTA